MSAGVILPGFGPVIETEDAGGILPGFGPLIQTEAAAATITGPLIGSSHLMTNGPLINGRLVA